MSQSVVLNLQSNLNKFHAYHHLPKDVILAAVDDGDTVRVRLSIPRPVSRTASVSVRTDELRNLSPSELKAKAEHLCRDVAKQAKRMLETSAAYLDARSATLDTRASAMRELAPSLNIS